MIGQRGLRLISLLALLSLASALGAAYSGQQWEKLGEGPPVAANAVSAEFQAAVLVATNSIWLQKDSVVVSGNLIVNEASSGPTLNSGVELSIAQDVLTTADSVLKADSIKIAKGADVGQVVYNQLDNRGTVAGEVTPLGLPVIDPADLPPFESGIPGSEDVTVAKDQTVVLPEGDYRDIVIEKGGTLIFGEAGGPLTYNVSSIRGKLQSKLLFPALTRVRVAHTVDVDKDSVIAPAMIFDAGFEAADESGASGADVIFFVAGVQGTQGAAIGQNSRVAANFYVPNGGLFLHNGTHAIGGFFARDIRVGVGGLLERANFFANARPTDILLDNASVDEGLPVGTAVGTFTTVDPDPGDVHAYALVPGAGDDDNALFSIVGDELRTAVVFSVAGTSLFSIRVQTDDGNGGTFEKTFAITVNDVTGPPVDILLDNAAVDENQPAGTLVGTFTSVDPDPGDVHTYTLVAGAGDSGNGAFTISGDQLLTAATFDFETQASYSIRVRSDDGTSGSFDKAFTIDVLDLNDPPIAGDDSYAGAIGNTRLALVVAPSPATPSPPTVELVGSVLDNDVDEDSPPDNLATTVNPAIVTAGGGSVAMAADGRFVYDPPAGFSGGSDSFDYEVCDDGTEPPGPLCVTATVSIEVQELVWYVDDSAAAAGSGTGSDPFQNLDDAGAASTPGDTIFVYEGVQVTGIALQDAQELLGQGLDLIVVGTKLVDAAGRPTIANAAGTAVVLGGDNTIRGLDISGSRDGIVGSDFGALTVNNVAISTSGGPALDLTSGAADITLDGLSSTGSSGLGVDLESVGGSLDLGTGAIAGAASQAVSILDGSANLTYAGSIDSTTVQPLLVSGQSAGALTFSGPITSTGLGVSLVNNGGGTIHLDGGLALTTGAADALTATGGGTLNITGINTIETTTGVGLRVTDTDIGSSGLTFERISVNGGSNGIVLNGTGSAGGLTITGDGSLTRNASGGVIANTSGAAVVLTDTQDFDAASLDLIAPGGHGMAATDLRGSNNRVRAARISGVSGASADGVRIVNTGVDLGGFELDDSLFTGVDGGGNDGLFVNALGNAVMRIDVRDSEFDSLRGDGVQINPEGASSVTVNLTGNLFATTQDFAGGSDNSRLTLLTGGTARLTVVATNNRHLDTGTQPPALPVDRNVGVVDIVVNDSATGIGRFRGNTIQEVDLEVAQRVLGDDNAASLDFVIEDNDVNDVREQEAVLIYFRDAVVQTHLSVIRNRFGTGPDRLPGGGDDLPIDKHGVELRVQSRNTVNGTCLGCVNPDAPILANVAILDNLIVNSDAVAETLDLESEVDAGDGSSMDPAATLNLNVLGNTLVNLDLGGSELEVDSEDGIDVGETQGRSRLCLDLAANDLDGGAGLIADLDEDAGTQAEAELDIVQDSPATAGSGIHAVNGIPAGNVNEVGTPNYGAVASCMMPTHDTSVP